MQFTGTSTVTTVVYSTEVSFYSFYLPAFPLCHITNVSTMLSDWQLRVCQNLAIDKRCQPNTIDHVISDRSINSDLVDIDKHVE